MFSIFTFAYTKYSIYAPLDELYKKHSVCTKIGLFKILNRKIFWGGGRPPDPCPGGEGDTPSPHPPPRRLRRIDPRAFGARTWRSQSSSFRKRSLEVSDILVTKLNPISNPAVISDPGQRVGYDRRSKNGRISV